MKVTIPYNNFAAGKLDHDMMGRFDLPVYFSGADIVENFQTNFKGNAIYRTGFEDILGGAFQDCAFHEFRFKNDQNYIIVMYNTKFRFLSYDINGLFGWVLDGSSNILEVTHPYSLAECRELSFAQNADSLVITHPSHTPAELKRVSANLFTYGGYYFRSSHPFNAKTNVISGATKANPCVLTVTADELRTGDFVTISGVGGMTELNGNEYRITRLTSTTLQLDGVDSTGFGTYTSGGLASRAADYPAVCLFYKARLFFAATPRKPTTIWASETGVYDNYAIPSSVTDVSPIQITVADVSEPFEWLFAGDNSLVAGSTGGIVAINGGGNSSAITPATIEANITSAEGCNNTYPIKKDGLVFYVAKNFRNMYSFRYDLLTESFIADDANIMSYDITEGDMGKIRWKKDKDDIIYAVRGDGALLQLNFNKAEKIAGWSLIKTNGLVKDISVITDNLGNPQLFILCQRNGNFYIERLTESIKFVERSSFFTWDGIELYQIAKKRDDEAYQRKVADQMRSCCYVDNALYYENLFSSTITFTEFANTITSTAGDFVVGDVGKHIVYKTLTGYEFGRFEITGYVSPTVVNVAVLQTPSSFTHSLWYKSFNTLSGLSQFNGQTVAVVVDGGYFDDVEVVAGAITINQEATSILVGYSYRGLIKSFSMGMQAGQENTQGTKKMINGFTVRFMSSAGGKVGSSLYRLQPVQELALGDLNYLPPPPIDGTKYVAFLDDAEKDKFFYIVQDVPLPLTVTCIMPSVRMTGQ